jgi:hypothetical protein
MIGRRDDQVSADLWSGAHPASDGLDQLLSPRMRAA